MARWGGGKNEAIPTSSSSEQHGPRPVDGQGPGSIKEARQQLRRANRKLAKQREENAALRTRLAKAEAGDEAGGVKPENIVWVLGSGRTGSTWLSSMMQALPEHVRWNEPVVGYLFGHLYYQRSSIQDKQNFILSNHYRETWLSAIRSLVLDGATARYPEVAVKGGYVVIKEPHGSLGAPLIVEAIPESRMIFLVRDPRDVAASTMHTMVARNTPERLRKAEERPDEFVRRRATSYLRDIERTKQAYEAHKGRKALVRYEDLRADALGTMGRIYSELEIPFEEEELSRAVEKHSWENIPDEKKGPGTVRRKATPGGWREDLTPEQAKIVEGIAAPLLKEFYNDAPRRG